MREARHAVLPAQVFVKQHVQRRGRQPFLAPDHVRDFHQVVVHDVGQMVSGQVVGALVQHFVVQNVGIHRYLSPDHVLNRDGLPRIDLDAHHVGCSGL